MPPSATKKPRGVKKTRTATQTKAAAKRKAIRDAKKAKDIPKYPELSRYEDTHIDFFLRRLIDSKAKQTHGKNFRSSDLLAIALVMREEFKIHFTSESLKAKWQNDIKPTWGIWLRHLSHASGYNGPPDRAPTAVAAAREAHEAAYPECHRFMDGTEPQWKHYMEELVGDEMATGDEAATAADLVAPQEDADTMVIDDSSTDSDNDDDVDLDELSDIERSAIVARRAEKEHIRAKKRAEADAAKKRVHRVAAAEKLQSTAAQKALEPFNRTLAEYLKTQEIRATLPPPRQKSDMELLSDRVLDATFLPMLTFDRKMEVLDWVGPEAYRVSIGMSLLAVGREKELENFVQGALSRLDRPAQMPERFVHDSRTQPSSYGYPHTPYNQDLLPEGRRW